MKIAVIIVCLALPALAADAPSQMTPLDAAQLHAAMAEIDKYALIVAPYYERVNTLCSKYKISRQELGRSVAVNFETGEIVRQKAK